MSSAHSGAQLEFRRSAAGRAPDIRPIEPDEVLSRACAAERRISAELIALMVAAVVAAVWVGVAQLYPLVRLDLAWFTTAPTQQVVERIIRAESNGNANARNNRSTAAGAGQFIDQTWLETVRTHRRDLLLGRSDVEVLELRADSALVREMVARTVERNAAMLRKRGLPVTPGTLYLAHFAGPAGAVALLTVSDDVDAASVMAKADASGRGTREKLVKANPFLETYTAGALKSWADRKMKG